ncbi:uncharacterized protein UTRI_00913 [Ustilago trichophora]|uniref:Uncharacterized protein n=1 Tax=Ustilago trichophora TaxID=86804 RepID=A0A5C3DW80_9BASI|nr:uncharacterized protein UTRI_00913 [Ustilago trichophora]
MSSGCSTPHSEASSSSSGTVIEACTTPVSLPSATTHDQAGASLPSSPSFSPPHSPESKKYVSSSYAAKGKRRASDDNVPTSPFNQHIDLAGAMDRLSVQSASSPASTQPTFADSSANPTHISLKGLPSDRFQPHPESITLSIPPSPPSHEIRSSSALPTSFSSPRPTERDRRSRKARDVTSRSVAPSPLHSSLTPSPTTGSASQFVSLLGQPVAVSASLSAPNKTSAAATSAVLPSLYKASRGRSANVSPSRRWDRRGASATVLSGASASGSGGEGDDVSEDDLNNDLASRRASRTKTLPSSMHNSGMSAQLSSRRLSVPKEQALFPSDEDDSPPLSPSEHLGAHAGKIAQHRRRSRRWSSIERERSRGMRILLQGRPAGLDASSPVEETGSKPTSVGRGRSANRSTRLADEDASDFEQSSSPSSCTSSCDLNYVPRATDTPAIPIRERRSRSNGRNSGVPDSSVSVASSQGHVPSSTDGSDDPSPAASTPSTSLVQRSPPGFTALKPIVAIPVTSESDPLLGHAAASVEDMIQVDKVEFFPEEAITAQLSLAKGKRRTSPKQSKKSSWIIGDFESEPESDDEQPSRSSLEGAVNRSHATAISASPPSPTASSYQARLASLQSQLRIWSRTQDTSAAPRVRQISSGSEDQNEPEVDAKDADTNSPGLLSASWRNLARLPNLILLPGLAARQARESLASSSKAQAEGVDGHNADRGSSATTENDFAQIYRLASSTQSPSDEKILQAQRNVALKTGRPPSPSPSPSPPASLLGSRQSSNDSISTSDKGQHPHNVMGAPRRGRGVASPLEADRDPSAYVSGLGQPIDPDTELSSVVQLQTFRSRSRSRPADVRHRGTASDDPRRDASRHSVQRGRSDEVGASLSLKKLGQPIELEPTDDEKAQSSCARNSRRATRSLASRSAPSEPLTVQIPKPSVATESRSRLDRHDPFSDGPAPTDTASAPTSPTFGKSTSSSAASSADETDSSVPSPPRQGESEGREKSSVDADGFRVVRRRHRRRSSGPRSLRPKVDALVPQGYSAFAIDEEDENAEGSDSEGDVTPSPSQARRNRGRRGRDSSPRRSTRQCAVGLFGGGVSAVPITSSLQSISRTRRSSRREGSHVSVSTPIRSVRSSPDLTYAAAAAAAREGEAESQDQSEDDPSPPRGSRGRRGAVKVVNSSVGQRSSKAQPLLLGGLEGLRRGPSYPPRAGQILDDASDGGEDDSASSPQSGPMGGRGRSASSPTCGNAGAPQAFRFRLLSNSSHLLMLSLELDMIKKQKISAPLKPRWGKHRANDFNPLPSTVSYSATDASSKYLRSPFSGSGNTDAEDGCEDGDCTPCVAAIPLKAESVARAGGIKPISASGLRDPSSRLRYSWSLADIASALDAATATATVTANTQT